MQNKSRLIEAQQGKCACCQATLVPPTVYDNEKNTVLCKVCTIVVNALRSYWEPEKALVFIAEYMNSIEGNQNG